MKYTRRQIVEAIRYWTAVLEAGNYKRINWPKRGPADMLYTAGSSTTLARHTMINRMLVVLAQLAGVEPQATQDMIKNYRSAFARARKATETCRKTLFDAVMREYGFKSQLPEFPARPLDKNDGTNSMFWCKAQKEACYYDVAALFAQEYQKRRGDPAELKKMQDLCDRIGLDLAFARHLSSLKDDVDIEDQLFADVGPEGLPSDATMFSLGRMSGNNRIKWDRKTNDCLRYDREKNKWVKIIYDYSDRKIKEIPD